MRSVTGVALLLLSLFWSGNAPAAEPVDAFALRDGDVVAFLGDSNTQWGRYPYIIEGYARTRYPGRRLSFYNSGVAGDTAIAAYYTRLQRDVLDRSPRPNKVFIVFGLNDIDWGRAEGEWRKQLEAYFLQGIREIVATCLANGIQPYVLSYPTLEKPAPELLAQDPWLASLAELNEAEDSPLKSLSRQAMEESLQQGAQVVDIQRSMRELAQGDPVTEVPLRHLRDGVHLNEYGHQLLAYSVLRVLGAPVEVSSLVLDAQGTVLDQRGTRAEAVEVGADGLAFTKVDEAFPFIQGFQIGANPPPDMGSDPMRRLALDRLRITGLSPGNYEIKAGSYSVSPEGGFTAQALADGIDLSHAGYSTYWGGTSWGSRSLQVRLQMESKFANEQARLQAFFTLGNDPSLGDMLTRLETQRRAIETTATELARPVPVRLEIHALHR